MAIKKGFTALYHAMVNSDNIVSEFCTILGLADKFGSLVNCGSVPANALLETTSGDALLETTTGDYLTET